MNGFFSHTLRVNCSGANRWSLNYTASPKAEFKSRFLSGIFFPRFEGLKELRLGMGERRPIARGAIDHDDAPVLDNREGIIAGLNRSVAHFLDMNRPLTPT